MSDAYAQINALLAATVAQQQKQQMQSQNQQAHSSTNMLTDTQRQQQQLLQQFNQFANNTNSQQASASNFLNPMAGGMPALNEQSLQALLYAQSMQKNSMKNNMNNNNMRSNINQNIQNFGGNNNMFQSNNQQQSFLRDTSNENDTNSFFQLNAKDQLFPSNKNQFYNNQNQQQRYNQQHQMEPPTRVLEPYFSDDSPHNSLEHQLMGNINRENPSHQIDIMSEFQKISLNEQNQPKSNSNQNNNNNNTSSNFDNTSMFSLNDSEIYSNEQNYLPGTASLIEDVDKQIMVVLRDGRTLIGYLRSIDQYANLLLSSTFERIHVGKKYGDIPKGIYIIRGENVVLIGEVDFKLPVTVEMTKVEVNEILELQRVEQEKEKNEKSEKKALLERCAIPNTDAVLDEYY